MKQPFNLPVLFSERSPVPDFKYLRLRDVQAVLPLSKAAIYAKVAAGQFPRPVKLGARASAWRSDHVADFMRSPATYRAPAEG